MHYKIAGLESVTKSARSSEVTHAALAIVSQVKRCALWRNAQRGTLAKNFGRFYPSQTILRTLIKALTVGKCGLFRDTVLVTDDNKFVFTPSKPLCVTPTGPTILSAHRHLVIIHIFELIWLFAQRTLELVLGVKSGTGCFDAMPRCLDCSQLALTKFLRTKYLLCSYGLWSGSESGNVWEILAATIST